MTFQQYRRAFRCYLSTYLECENYLRAGIDLKASFLHLINEIFYHRSSKLMGQWRGFLVLNSMNITICIFIWKDCPKLSSGSQRFYNCKMSWTWLSISGFLTLMFLMSIGCVVMCLSVFVPNAGYLWLLFHFIILVKV